MVTWQFITQADVEITDYGATLRQDNQLLKLVNLSHPKIQFTVVSLDPPPHRLDKKMDKLKRIELQIPVSADVDSFDIKVRLVSAR
jgi:hypothetical protein